MNITFFFLGGGAKRTRNIISFIQNICYVTHLCAKREEYTHVQKTLQNQDEVERKRKTTKNEVKQKTRKSEIYEE